jgi:hypothetical protein
MIKCNYSKNLSSSKEGAISLFPYKGHQRALIQANLFDEGIMEYILLLF